MAVGWNLAGNLGAEASGPQLAQVQPPAAVLQTLASADGAAPQVMLRDARLDALMVAHRQFGGTSALQMPAGFLRNATYEGTVR